jgi:hypothetical protein
MGQAMFSPHQAFFWRIGGTKTLLVPPYLLYHGRFFSIAHVPTNGFQAVFAAMPYREGFSCFA